jgi:hypothetical protein
MPKDDTSKKAASGRGKKKAASKTAKKSRVNKKEASTSDSSNELEAVRTKKGEPANNLRQRAEWFQKRH